jgi:hypothetical protein
MFHDPVHYLTHSIATTARSQITNAMPRRIKGVHVRQVLHSKIEWEWGRLRRR